MAQVYLWSSDIWWRWWRNCDIMIMLPRPYIAEVDMLMATVEFAKLLPCWLPLADIVIDPQPPTRVQLASTWCQWLKQLLQTKVWFCGTSIWSRLTSWLENLPFWSISLSILREGCRKKNPYFLWSFAKPGGGGSARVVKKPYCFFEKKYFFREHVESF